MQSLFIRAAVSLLPIVFAFYSLAVLNKQAKYIMWISWLISFLLALFLWKTDIVLLIAATINGLLIAITIVIVIWGAVLLLNTLKETSAMNAVQEKIAYSSSSKCYQGMLLGFGLSTFIEGAAGFGTPAALVSPILVGIGFPAALAVSVALIGHSVAVSFGAVGTPILGGLRAALDNPLVLMQLPKGLTEWLSKDIPLWNSIFLAIGGIFVIPLAIVLMIRKHYFQDKGCALSCLPFAFLAGLFFFAIQICTAYFLGAELPSLLGGIVATATIFLTRKKYQGEGNSQGSNVKKSANRNLRDDKFTLAIFAYILVALILVMTRIPFIPVRHSLASFKLHFNNILGTPISWAWNFLYSPGIIPFFIISAFCWAIVKMPWLSIRRILSSTTRQVSPALIALSASIAMAQIMIYSDYNAIQQSGMITSIAEAVSKIFGQGFPFISPWIGALGAFMVGSNTGSNILFASFQFKVATELNISPTHIIALQSAGGAIGNIIAIHNVVAALTTVGGLGSEGKVLRSTLTICAASLSLLGLAGIILSRCFAF